MKVIRPTVGSRWRRAPCEPTPTLRPGRPTFRVPAATDDREDDNTLAGDYDATDAGVVPLTESRLELEQRHRRTLGALEFDGKERKADMSLIETESSGRVCCKVAVGCSTVGDSDCK